MAIFSLYSIKLLVFITEMEHVYYALRTEFLNIILVALHFVFKLTPCAKLQFSATYSQRSTSHFATFLTAKICTLFLVYLYPKDERVMSKNLHSSKLVYPPPPPPPTQPPSFTRVCRLVQNWVLAELTAVPNTHHPALYLAVPPNKSHHIFVLNGMACRIGSKYSTMRLLAAPQIAFIADVW
jgi:hypothetical protein